MLLFCFLFFLVTVFERRHELHRYKVIDVKPALGFLFREDIKDSDFWGHIDNDMLMGNVRGILTEEMLSNYDIISGLKRGQTGKDILSTWGPFTIYRNTPKVTEFFRELDLKHIYDTIDAMFVDEWGGDEWSFYNWSMTKLINDRAEARGIRVDDKGLNTGWDGNCYWKEELHTAKRCSECILKRDPSTGANILTWNRSLFLASPDDYPCYEVTLCHFQFGKKHSAIESSTRGRLAELVNADPLYYGYNEGFTSTPKVGA